MEQALAIADDAADVSTTLQGVTAGVEERAARMGVELRFGRAGLLDAVEHLWLGLFDHHTSVGAAGLPVIARELSWPRRRALYETLLGKPDAFVLLATRDQAAVGYVLAHIHEGADDTWPTGSRIGEIESLVVLPSVRGVGLGNLLMDAAEQRLAEVGAHDVLLRVLVGNDGARRFYQRRGMTAVMTTMLKLGSPPTERQPA